MTKHPPTDLDELRAEIGELAHRVEQLAAKSDIPARVRSTALDGIDTAKDVAAAAAHQAAVIAGVAAGLVHGGVESWRSSIEHRDVPYLARRSAPLGAIVAGAAAVGIGIYLLTRRRH